MAKEAITYVLFLDKDTLTWFVSTTGEVFSIQLDNTVLHEMEIVDPDKLHKILAAVVENKKLSPGSIIMIMASSIFFTFELSNDPTISVAEQLTDFAQHSPFTSVFTKDISIGKEKYGICLNRELYENLLSSFSKLDFTFETLVPDLLVKAELAGGFTAEFGNTIIKMKKKLEQQDLLEPDKKRSAISSLKIEKEGGSKKRTFMLGSVFLLLIFTLVFMYLRMQKQNEVLFTPPPAPQSASVPEDTEPEEIASSQASSAAELVEVLSASASADPVLLQQQTVMVSNASSTSGLASTVAEELEELGFLDVQSENYTGVTITEPQMLINQEVPPEVRTYLLKSLTEKGIEPEINIVSDTQYDIQLILVSE